MFLLQHFSDTSENWEASWYHILMGRIKEQDGLVIVPVKIQFDKTYQVQQTFLLQGLQNVLKIPKVI